MSGNKLIFTPPDSSFRLVASYLMALKGFVSAVEIYNADEEGTMPCAEEDTTTLDALACSQRLVWRPYSLVTAMVRNRWPSEISFDVEAIAPTPISSIQLGVLENFLYGLGQSLVTNFFEQERDRLEARYGRPSAGWPSIWNFGRVVRNAMSHGGQVDIRDSTQVSWKSLSYSGSDNGRRIVNVDIWPGDLFLLIRELQDALP